MRQAACVNTPIPERRNKQSPLTRRHLASLKGTCPYYRPNKKVRYAAGFVSLLESLPHKQMLSVIPGLMRHFSRRTYYRVRKGERPLSPSEQQVVLNALKRCGVKRGLCHYPCYGCANSMAHHWHHKVLLIKQLE